MPPLPNERASHHPDALAAAGSRAGTQKQTIMIPILQATPIAPESSSGNLFYLFLVFCIIVVAINVSRLIKRHQRRCYYQGNSATTSNESDVNPEEYGYTTEQGETLFDDVKPEDDEVEYKIIGTNHRDLSKRTSDTPKIST